MNVASRDFKVIVVSETDRLLDMARASAEELGEKLREGRAVRAQAKRFAKTIAADPSPLHVEVLDVVGYCAPDKERPNQFEPIVIHEGKPVPVSFTYIAAAGDYWVCTAEELVKRRARIVSDCARRLAEEAALCEAMSVAIDAADPDATLSGYSLDPRELTVDFYEDSDGEIAKRLPKWLKVAEHGGSNDAT